MRGVLHQRGKGISLVELLVVLAIMSVTTTLLLSIGSPEDSQRQSTKARLVQLADAIRLYNLNNPSKAFTDVSTVPDFDYWAQKLPGINRDSDLQDPWGNIFHHVPDSGYVYSCGPDGIDNVGTGDDIVEYYRPPSAAVIVRRPVPKHTTAELDPEIFVQWRLAGATGIATAVVAIDRVRLPQASIILDSSDSIHTDIVRAASYPLKEGIHSVAMEVEDERFNKSRAAWVFRVDASPPNIYALNPAKETPPIKFEQRHPLISALYSDQSGIDLESFQLTFQGVNNPGGYPGSDPICGVGVFDKNNIKSFPGRLDVSPTGFTLRCENPSGLPPDQYDVGLTIEDSGGNSASVNWSFIVTDETAPMLSILEPTFGQAITTSNDVLASMDDVQVAVVGTTEHLAMVDLQVLHELGTGAAGPSPFSGLNQVKQDHGTVTQLTTRAGADGHFEFPYVTLKSSDGVSHIPTNVILAWAEDPQGNRTVAPASQTVYLYDEVTRLRIYSVDVKEKTTHPNEPILFSVAAESGTTPYTYVWDYRDGFKREGNLSFEREVSSVRHTYLVTGNYDVLVTVKDAKGLTATTQVPIYIGTEEFNPSILVYAEPWSFPFGPQNAAHSAEKRYTEFKIRIGGRYLGFWRLQVLSNAYCPGWEWWYTNRSYSEEASWASTNFKDGHTGPVFDTDIPLDHHTNPVGPLWQPAQSNEFVVPWYGQDNTVDNGGGGFDQRGFPTNVLETIATFNNYHVATLHYVDAMETAVSTDTTVQLLNHIPVPQAFYVYGVDYDPYHPDVFDMNRDKVPDYTRNPLIDLLIAPPICSNPLNLWISNYPLCLHKILDTRTPPIVGAKAYSDYVTETIGGEVFRNWTDAAGFDYDATDGSSGWTPIRFTQPPVYDNWDVTASPGLGSLAWHVNPYTRLNNTGHTKDQVHGDQFTLTDGSTLRGLNLSADGWKSIWVIYQEAGPFISTEIVPKKSQCTDGTTWTYVFLDRTPPVSASALQLQNVDVAEDGSVTGNILCTATDTSFNGVEYFTGSGVNPDGRVLVKSLLQSSRSYPYATTVLHTFGHIDNLESFAPSNLLTAEVWFQDNLGNSSSRWTIGGPPSEEPFHVATASLTKFVWTVIGRGDVRFFQSSDQEEVVIRNSSVDQADPKLEHWLSNGFNLPDGVTIEDRGSFSDIGQMLKSTNMDIGHFPDPTWRLGRVESKRPPDMSGLIDNSAAFPVDSDHKYGIVLVKLGTEVQYRVYEVPGSWNPSAVDEPQKIIDNGTLMAQVNKVSDPDWLEVRLNEGWMWIPEELFGGTDTGRSRDLHDSGGFFNDGEEYYWDQRPDLLASSGGATIETYSWRGVVAGYDGGRMENFVFKVTSNNFGVKMVFSPDEATEPPTNLYPYGGGYGGDPQPMYDGTDATLATTDAYKPFVRARQTMFGDGPGTLGWGYSCENTMFVDEASGGYAPKPEGSNEVTGSSFKVRLSDYRTDFPAGFSYMTTGSVSARIWLEFDSTAPTVAQSCIAIALNGAVTHAQPELYTLNDANLYSFVALEDTRAEPKIYSGTITWPYFTNPIRREGILRMHVQYKDAEGNRLTEYTTETNIDASPPSGPGPGGACLARCAGFDFTTYRQNATTTLQSNDSAACTTWVSASAGGGLNKFRIAYYVSDGSAIYREFVPNAFDGTDEANCSEAPIATEGPADPSGDPNRWWALSTDTDNSFFPGMAAPNDNEVFALTNTADGVKTFNLRFRDDSYNVFPIYTPNTDDGVFGGEKSIITSFTFDKTAPTVVTANYAVVHSGGAESCTSGSPNLSAYKFSNDTSMQWSFRGSDGTGVGVVGFNIETALDNPGVPNPSEYTWPPQVSNMANAYSAHTYTKTYSGYTGADGRRWIGVRPFDALGNRPFGMPDTTRRYFYVRDTTGPIIQAPGAVNTHLGLNFRVTNTDGPWVAETKRGPYNHSLHCGSLDTDSSDFAELQQCSWIRIRWLGGKEAEFERVVLKLGGSSGAVVFDSANPLSGTDAYKTPLRLKSGFPNEMLYIHVDPPVNCDRVEITGMSSHSSTEAAIDVQVGNGVAETVYSISTSNKNEETRSWPFSHPIQSVARMAVVNYAASSRQKVTVKDVWFNDATDTHRVSQAPDEDLEANHEDKRMLCYEFGAPSQTITKCEMRSDKDDDDQAYRIQITAISNKRPGPPPSLAGETWIAGIGLLPLQPPSSSAKYVEFAWNDVVNNMTTLPLASAGAVDSTTACGFEVAGCDNTRNNRWHYIYENESFSQAGTIDNTLINPSGDLPAGRVGLILPIIPNSFTNLHLACEDKLGNMGPYYRVIKIGNDQIPPAMNITALDVETGLEVAGGTPWLPSDNVRIVVECTDGGGVTELEYIVRQGGSVIQASTTISTSPAGLALFELVPDTWVVGGGGSFAGEGYPDANHQVTCKIPTLVTDYQYEIEFYARDTSGNQAGPYFYMVGIDTGAPTATLNAIPNPLRTNTWNNTAGGVPYNVTGTFNDGSGSGCEFVYLDVGDGGGWRPVTLTPTGPPEAPYRTGTWTYAWNEQVNDYDNSGGGVNTTRNIQIYAQDFATNTSAIPIAAQSQTRLVDNCNPVITNVVKTNNNSPGDDFAAFDLRCPETTNHESNLMVSIWGDAACSVTQYVAPANTSSPANYNLGDATQNAAGFIYVKVQDNAGNVSTTPLKMNDPPALTINSVVQSGGTIQVNFTIADTDATKDNGNIDLTNLRFSLQEHATTAGAPAALTHATAKALPTGNITAGSYLNLSVGGGQQFTWNATASAWDTGLDGRWGYVRIYGRVTDGKDPQTVDSTNTSGVEIDFDDANPTASVPGDFTINAGQSGTIDATVGGSETGDGLVWWWTRAGNDIDTSNLGSNAASGTEDLTYTGDYQTADHTVTYTFNVRDRYKVATDSIIVTVRDNELPTNPTRSSPGSPTSRYWDNADKTRDLTLTVNPSTDADNGPNANVRYYWEITAPTGNCRFTESGGTTYNALNATSVTFQTNGQTQEPVKVRVRTYDGLEYNPGGWQILWDINVRYTP